MTATPEADIALATAVAVDTLVSQDSAAGPKAHAAACANCGSPGTGSYCSTCGQKAVPLNPSLQYFLHEAANELLNFDGKILRSVRLLVTRPGFLTREVFAGRRASYVSPIRLYLVFSVIAFALGAAVPSSGMNVQYTPSPGETIGPEVELRLAENVASVNAALNTWVPRAMFLLVPLLAAFVMLSRRRSALNYPQHVYFALHVLAVYFLLESLLSGVTSLDVPSIVRQGVSVGATSLFLVYFVLAYRTAYGTTVWGSLWRSGIVLFLYFLSVTVTLLSIALPAMFGAWSDTTP
jgi:hypothetical protein